MNEPRGQVVLVRHGETDWSRAGRHTGRTDIPLDQAGRHQGARLREHLAGRGFARVLTSPLSRAVETCELAGLAEGAEKLDDLQEWDYGACEGQTSDQIRAHRPQWSLWDDGVPEGETLAEVAARADRVVAILRGTGPAPVGDVAVFAHGHLLRVLAVRWMGLDPAVGRCLALYAGSLSTMGWEHAQPVVVSWNYVSHLMPGRSGFSPPG
ncbi:MAG: histidine phosphatase family protein [Acidimicrobiales bacterium]|nr:MAG: histidine phosphatase family protein [Acidimicrobiales bacterium]